MSDNPAESSNPELIAVRSQRDAARKETRDWQMRQQSLASLFTALQTSHDQLQHDHRRLSQAHQTILLAYGSLLREHRALTTGLGAVIERERTPPSGDSGIEFTEQMECNKQHCPTTPPHRHITPTHPPKMPGRGVPPCPDRINDIAGSASANQVSDRIITEATPRTASTISDALTHARFQAELDDDFGDSDVNPTRENPNHFKNSREVPSNRLPPSLDINQGPPASNTSEKGGTQGNPAKKPMDVNNIVGGPNEAELVTRRAYQDALEQKAADIYNQAFDNPEVSQQLRDSARIASKFADAGGEVGPHVTDPEVVSDCGFQAQDGSDETRNIPDKQTEDR